MINCPFCNSSNIDLYLSEDFGISSDATIINNPIKAYLCKDCLNVFKIRELQDSDIINKMYENYILHSINGHFEQRVAFDKYKDGKEKSEYILEYINKNIELPQKGKLLDIGSHFGSFLKYFNKKYPKWDISGYDVSKRYKNTVEKISSNSHYSMDLNSLSDKYDLIVISHVLEHTDNPLNLLKKAKELLIKDGKIFIQSNNLTQNPFLPIIFEQHSSFSYEGIQNITASLGLKVVNYSIEWIPKEFTLVLEQDIDGFHSQLSNELKILQYNKDIFRKSINTQVSGKVSILGTSYTAKWLVKKLKLDLEYFIDDDINIQGSIIDGVHVISSNNISINSLVLLPFPIAIAKSIKNRLDNKYNGTVTFLLPPFKIERR